MNFIIKYFNGFLRYKNWFSILFKKIILKKPNNVKCRNGIVIYGPENSHTLGMVNDIFFNNIYNKFGFSINENDIVFDVGANIGVFSVKAMKTKLKKLYIIEPSTDNIKYIKNNLKVNNCIGDYMIINNPLTGKKETVFFEFNIENNEGNLVKKEQSVNSVKFESVTLKEIIENENLDKINFLKIDCEGSEGNIISNLEEDIFTKIDKIVMEYHDHVSELNHKEIENILKKNYFKVILEEIDGSPFGLIYASK